MRVIFFGTPLFAAHVLEDLFRQCINIVAVVSKPDRPQGRSLEPIPTPVKLVAQAFDPQLPIYQPEVASDLAFADTLQKHQADLFVVVAYGEIIKEHLLKMPRQACINLHASLLPKYRGAAPIQRCLINGEKETGVTIIHMVKKMDAGEMIKKASIPVGEETTFAELEQQLCEVGKQVLKEAILEFAIKTPLSTPQDITQVTFAPKIELEDCEIHWELPAQQLHNLIRGVNPYPGAWCFITFKGEKKRLKIYHSKIYLTKNAVPATCLSISPHQLVIATGDQALELVEIQLEGKKRMTGEEFLRGHSLHHFSFQSPITLK